MPIRPKQPTPHVEAAATAPLAQPSDQTPKTPDQRVLAGIAANPLASATTIVQNYNKGSLGDSNISDMRGAIRDQVAEFERVTSQRSELCSLGNPCRSTPFLLKCRAGHI